MASGADGLAREITGWAVNGNFNVGNGWNLNANDFDNPNEWNAGNRVLSLLLFFSRLLWAFGSFVYQSFPPAAQHSADFLKLHY